MHGGKLMVNEDRGIVLHMEYSVHTYLDMKPSGVKSRAVLLIRERMTQIHPHAIP